VAADDHRSGARVQRAHGLRLPVLLEWSLVLKEFLKERVLTVLEEPQFEVLVRLLADWTDVEEGSISTMQKKGRTEEARRRSRTSQQVYSTSAQLYMILRC